MAWYHQYQYASVKMAEYPQLRNMALPILRYEIAHDGMHILRVEVQIKDGQTMWFKYPSQVSLYKSGKDLITMPEQASSEKMFDKLLRAFNLKRR